MKEIKNSGKKKFKFIGMRVIKTVISVYLSFLISFFRDGIPFYSAIAAILCTQSDHTNSIKVAKSRVIGTFIGGVYGFLGIVLINNINIQLNGYIHYLILSLFLIPIIYTNVGLKSNTSAYISCVVFFTITVTTGRTMGPMAFAINRMVDTLIGIIVSLVVNHIM